MRAFLFIICASLAVCGCENQPFEVNDLTILAVKGSTSSGTTPTAESRTFTYRAHNVLTFVRTGGTSPVSMKFFYSGNDIDSITADSALSISYLSKTDSLRKYSYKRLVFERSTESVVDRNYQYVIDSIFNITDRKNPVLKSVSVTTTTVSVREVVFDGSGAPLHVEMTTWPLSVETNLKADLTWDDKGNVNRIFTTTTIEGNVVTKETIFRYDDQQSGYRKNPQYVYTLDPHELYWMSTNNPVVMNDGTGEKIYVYSYNKLGYPSSYISDTGNTYGISYRQL